MVWGADVFPTDQFDSDMENSRTDGGISHLLIGSGTRAETLSNGADCCLQLRRFSDRGECDMHFSDLSVLDTALLPDKNL